MKTPKRSAQKKDARKKGPDMKTPSKKLGTAESPKTPVGFCRGRMISALMMRKNLRRVMATPMDAPDPPELTAFFKAVWKQIVKDYDELTVNAAIELLIEKDLAKSWLPEGKQ